LIAGQNASTVLTMIMQSLRPIEAKVRRSLLVGAALLASLVPGVLMPENAAALILFDWFQSICLDRIGGIAAATNALTLVP